MTMYCPLTIISSTLSYSFSSRSIDSPSGACFKYSASRFIFSPGDISVVCLPSTSVFSSKLTWTPFFLRSLTTMLIMDPFRCSRPNLTPRSISRLAQRRLHAGVRHEGAAEQPVHDSHVRGVILQFLQLAHQLFVRAQVQRRVRQVGLGQAGLPGTAATGTRPPGLARAAAGCSSSTHNRGVSRRLPTLSA